LKPQIASTVSHPTGLPQVRVAYVKLAPVTTSDIA